MHRCRNADALCLGRTARSVIDVQIFEFKVQETVEFAGPQLSLLYLPKILSRQSEAMQTNGERVVTTDFGT